MKKKMLTLIVIFGLVLNVGFSFAFIESAEQKKTEIEEQDKLILDIKDVKVKIQKIGSVYEYKANNGSLSLETINDPDSVANTVKKAVEGALKKSEYEIDIAAQLTLLVSYNESLTMSFSDNTFQPFYELEMILADSQTDKICNHTVKSFHAYPVPPSVPLESPYHDDKFDAKIDEENRKVAAVFMMMARGSSLEGPILMNDINVDQIERNIKKSLPFSKWERRLTKRDGRKIEIKEEKDKEGATPAVSVSGKWELSIQGVGVAMVLTVYFVQEETALTGKMKTPFGVFDLSGGTVSGNDIYFKMNLPIGSQEQELSFSGTIEGDRITGTVAQGTGESAEFTGRRIQ